MSDISNTNGKCRSVFFRIFTSTLGLCALIIISAVLLGYSLLERDLERNAKNILGVSSSLITDCLDAGLPLDKISRAAKSFDTELNIRTTLIGSRGEVLFDSEADALKMPNHLDRTEVKKALNGEKTFEQRHSETLFKRMIYVAAPAGKIANGGVKFCVRQSIPASSLAKSRQLLAADCAAMASIAILAAAVFSWLIAKRISTPLKRLTGLSIQYTNGNFDASPRKSNILEIDTLSESLSNMARNLKKRIKSLKKRNYELDEIFGQMAECVFICSQDGRIRRFNKALAKLFRIPEDAENLDTASSLRNSELLEAIDETFRTKKTVSKIVEVSTEGSYAITSTPLPYNSQNARALVVMRNVSPERRAERLRREFVSGVSHELKTPITSIKMCAETLSELDISQDAKHFAQMINSQSDRMANLVNDMLLLSRIEFTEEYAKKTFTRFKVRGLLAEALSSHAPQAESMEDSSEIICPDDLEISGDRTLVLIAVSSLVDNAVKYGGKNCKITLTGRKDGNKTIISVKDSGPGIAAEYLPRLFERFFRVDKGRSRALGGTGLGLAIVKHVAIMHGGEATVKSQINEGSEFSISIADGL